MSSIKNLNKGVIIANKVIITLHKVCIITFWEDEGRSATYIYKKTGIFNHIQYKIIKQ